MGGLSPACTQLGVMGSAHRADWVQAALAALEHAQLADSDALQQLERTLVVGADILGTMGVARQRHWYARFDAHLQQRGRRVDLLGTLAQAGRGDLDRHSGLGDTVERKLVVAT